MLQDNGIKPLCTSERCIPNDQFFKVIDLEELPVGKNSVTIAWTIPLWQRIRLLFCGKIWVSFRGKSCPPMRIDVHSCVQHNINLEDNRGNSECPFKPGDVIRHKKGYAAPCVVQNISGDRLYVVGTDPFQKPYCLNSTSWRNYVVTSNIKLRNINNHGN